MTGEGKKITSLKDLHEEALEDGDEVEVVVEDSLDQDMMIEVTRMRFNWEKEDQVEDLDQDLHSCQRATTEEVQVLGQCCN